MPRSCDELCLLLAVLRGRKDAPVTAIDNSVRRLVERPLTLRPRSPASAGRTAPPTVARRQRSSVASDGTAGIQVRFSRPVLTSTLTDGVVELCVIEGGRTKHAGVYVLEGEFESFGDATTVESFRFRYRGDENLDPGDRLMVTIRCAFILDECCRPVDGAHVGGGCR